MEWVVGRNLLSSRDLPWLWNALLVNVLVRVEVGWVVVNFHRIEPHL